MNPEAGRAGQSFPLPLSRAAEKCTVLWSVAGFDPSSGAGITADLMTFAAHGFFGCSAVTALTVQTTRSVFRTEAVAPDVLRETLERLDEDLPFAGLKVGMLGTGAAAEALAALLTKIAARGGQANAGRHAPVVLDPVLRSSSGAVLFPEEELGVLRDKLLPYVDWITPNWAELAVLSGERVASLKEAEVAARRLQERCPALRIVVTGGDQDGDPVDMLVAAGAAVEMFRGERIATRSTHGTGCAFSSALLCALVRGMAPVEAVRHAKSFVEGALRSAPGLGSGKGPLDLLWARRGALTNSLEPC